jgi:SAM-dependent methyltransferase
LHRHYAAFFHKQDFIADYNVRFPALVVYLALLSLALFAAAFLLRETIPLVAGVSAVTGVIVLLITLRFWLFVFQIQGRRQQMRQRLVHGLQLRGDEQILDVGTGSGVLVLECAKHLTTGKGIGIDIYDPHSGGGTPKLFWKNAHAEGVAGKVELLPMDARQMTFEAAKFDAVISSGAMHHMGGVADRQRVLHEMMRVLKPHGKIAIYDIAPIIHECDHVMREMGLVNIQQEQDVLHLITAEKP